MSNQIDRFGKCAILQLQTNGFEKLTLEKKKLVYFLSEAGLYGRNIFLQQNNEHNLIVKNVLESLYKQLKENELNLSSISKLENYLKTFWLHVGIYDGMSNKRLDVDFTEDEYNSLLSLGSENEVLTKENIELVRNVLFNSNFTKPLKNIQEANIDVVAESGGNFYKNLTSDEVDSFRKENYPEEHNSPQYGFNSRLVKLDNKEIKEQIIYKDGLYGDLIDKIINNLKEATKYTENEEQKESINSLIRFYQTGSPKDFDSHSLKWVQDKESEIFFINGLIESYDDPKGIGCTFESLVAFKNPEQTEKVNNIIKNIQWFESNMPVDDSYKKEEASGLSASSVTVAGMAGATSPTLPLGICLPNSDWIREKHGSKSVNLFNVANARGESEIELKKEFFLEEYQNSILKYGSATSSLHTDLHEVAGHGSCKSNDGISNESLGIYYSVIEEARADLVGLYYIGVQELLDFEIVNSDTNLEEFIQAAYINYITNGAMLQLKRVDYGDNLAQPHLRNRQLIVNWVLENNKDNCVELIENDGKKYVKINNFNSLRVNFGILLGKIQEIKSTGNFSEAKKIVEGYGTKVNKEIHKEVIDRVKILDTPSVYGFTTPIYKEIVNSKGEIIDYEVSQKSSFIEEQLYLSNKYN